MNNRWVELKKINSIHKGTALNISIEQNDSKDLVCLKYAPINSVGVETSFSMYKNILTPNRISFSENNLIWSEIPFSMYNF